MSDDKQFSYAQAAHVIDRRDAQTVADALTAEGIQCWTNFNSDINFAGTQIAGSPSGIIIIVLQDDLEKAKQVISEL